MFSPTESPLGLERAVGGWGSPLLGDEPASESLVLSAPGPLVAESPVCGLLCSALDVLHRILERGYFYFTNKDSEQVKHPVRSPG